MRSQLFLLPVLAALAAARIPVNLDIADELDFKLSLVPRQATKNLQTFTGALGGVKASAISQSSDSTRPFEVDGDTFNDFPTAANRACDNQHNTCAQLANDKKGDFKVGDCDVQSTECKAAISTATTTSFSALFSSNAEFDFFCDT